MKIKYLMAGFLTAILIPAAGCSNDEEEETVISQVNVIKPQSVKQQTINLGSTTDFAVLAGSKVSNVPTSSLTGDIGLSPASGTKITGFGNPGVNGTVYTSGPSGPEGSVADEYGLSEAKNDLTAAYNDAKGRTSTDIVLLSGDIGGLTLTPGLYKSAGSLEISSGDLTFDAKGNEDAVFIIQIASSLITSPGRNVLLSGGAKASNIFWQAGSSVSLGTSSVFKGTLLARQSISLNTGAAVEGRLLARIAAVTLENSTVVKP